MNELTLFDPPPTSGAVLGPRRAPARARHTDSVSDRLWARVDRSGDCWLWTGALDRNGYGRISTGGRGDPIAFVHRVAYELIVGPIPDGLVIDHLCRNRACCNPDHMEPVTDAENKRRGFSPSAVNARKTHCKRGHELSGDNVLVNGTGRSCRECRRDREREARRAAGIGPRTRRSDPQTSRDAAASLTPEALGREQGRVLRAISMHAGEAIRDQVAMYLSADRSCVSRRITDLRDLGLVEDSGRTRPGPSGRQQTVWCLTDAGRARVEAMR